MSNPDTPVRPSLASDLQIAQMHMALGDGLAEHGVTRLGASAFERNSHFTTISGARLRMIVPGVAKALNVGRQLFIESYPAVVDEDGARTPPQLEVVVTRPGRWRRLPMASETITIAQAYDPVDGFEVQRVVVPRKPLDDTEITMSPDEFDDWYDEMQRFHDDIGFNTVTTAETAALMRVAERLPTLTRPALGRLVGYASLACAGMAGAHGVRQDEA